MKNLLSNKYYKGYRVNWKNNYQPLRKDILNDIISLTTFARRLPDIHPILSCFGFLNLRGAEISRKEIFKFKQHFITCESKKQNYYDILIVEEKKAEDKKKHYHAFVIIDKNKYPTKTKLINRMQKLWHDINPDSNLYMQDNEHFHDLLTTKGLKDAIYAASYLAKENSPRQNLAYEKISKSTPSKRNKKQNQNVCIRKKYWSSLDTRKRILSTIHKEKIYRLKEILKIIKLSRSTLYNLISNGEFPEPLKQGKYCVWFPKDINDYFDNIKKSQK